MNRTCPSCGCTLPPVNDAFCSACHAPLDEESGNDQPGQATLATDRQIVNGPPYSHYDDVPLNRRSGVMSAYVLAGFFCFPPFLWLACIVCLTGDVYYNRVGKDGKLETWSSANKIVAAILLTLQIAGLVIRFSGLT